MSTTDFIKSFTKLKILVLGDIMMDAYYFGSVDRISPEAPVSVISVSQKDHRPGGAANVALNLKSLGASVSLCSIVGNDVEGKELVSLVSKEGINVQGIITDKSRPTTVKTRVISGSTHLLRIDHESTSEINDEIEMTILDFITENCGHFDAVIIEDYNKGMLTERLITKTISLCNFLRVLTIVDPKKDNFFAYKNCTLFKPNRKEIQEGLKTDKDLSKISNVEISTDELMNRLNCQYVMVTLSENGVFIKSKNESHHIEAHQRSITDVSGAGDTVVSVASLCLASGMNMKNLAQVSNIAGGLVCQKVGVAPIDLAELLTEVEHFGV